MSQKKSPSQRFSNAMSLIALFVALVFLFFAVVQALVDQQSPTERFAEQLAAKPPGQRLRMFLDAERSTARNVGAMWDDAKRQEWQSLIISQVETLSQSPDKLCEEAEFLQAQSVWPKTLSGTLRACEDWKAARTRREKIEAEDRQVAARYAQIERSVEQARRDVEVWKQRVREEGASVVYLHGWVHGAIGENVYEVSEGFSSRRMALRRIGQTFTTTGRFEMYVRRAGEVDITLKSGKKVLWPLLIEADKSGLVFARRQFIEAEQRLGKAQNTLKSTWRPRPTDLTSYNREVNNAALAIKETLKAAAAAPAHDEAPGKQVGASQAGGSEPSAGGIAATSKESYAGGPARMVELEKGTTAQKLMEKVCPPGSLHTENGSLACARCPKGAGDIESPPLTFEKGLIGSLSGRGEEAVVALVGCEMGFNFRHSSAFLRKIDGQWTLLSFTPVTDMTDCKALMVGAQSVLVCDQITVGGGSEDHIITLVSAAENVAYRELFTFSNDEGAGHFQGDYGPKIDSILAQDIDGDGIDELVVLMSVDHGRLLWPRSPTDDPFDDMEQGRVDVTTYRKAHVYKVTASGARAVRIDPDKVSDKDIRAYLLDKPPVDAAQQVEELLKFEPDSDAAWPIYERRLTAMRNAGQFDSLARETVRVSSLFEKHREQLQLQLAEAYEAAGRYEDARDFYHSALDGAGAALQGRAAWFWATAPAPFRDIERASRILAQAATAGQTDAYLAMAQAQILLTQGRADDAKETLKDYLKRKKSRYAGDFLASIQAGDVVPRPVPRDLVPTLPHKVPREWAAGVPEGALLAEERLFAVELAAIERRQKKDIPHALALYFGALERADSSDLKTLFRLGIGKTYEADGQNEKALKIYEAMLTAEPENPAILNRLAWFLLTTSDKEIRDLDRGRRLAEHAAALTQNLDPSVLDTLAEAHLRTGDPQRARALLARCITLDPTREYYRQRLE